MRTSVLLLLLASVAPLVHAQSPGLASLSTRAEATGYEETTRYDEVMGFVEAVDRASTRLHATHFGYTTEGRRLPLVVYGDVPDASAEAVRAAGKTRVFVMANIHGGEVCGKEAVLALLRSLAGGEHAAWADSLVVLFAPIYNADGNERIGLYNRPRQHGPFGGMGERANAQEFDLNRDHMKLDSPEARSLVRLMDRYDPHVVVDLHTTNGTYHAYHLTYAPPLHPNTQEPIVRLLRERWLPAVTERIRKEDGWHFHYYGNLPWRGMDVPRGWYTFDHRPRFNNNYVGLRNRIAILSEAYAYLTFEERIAATRRFVEEILDYAAGHASEIRAVTAAADAASAVGEPLGLRATFERSPKPTTILMGAVREETNPYTGAVVLRREDVVRPEEMDEYGTFRSTETTPAPEAYLVPADQAVALDRLRAHGIRMELLAAPAEVAVERFRIDSLQVAERPFQQRHEQTLFGAYEAGEVAIPAGTWRVPVDQPLGRLAFTLLEPRSDDGLVAWGFFEGALREAPFYPVLRVPALEGAP